MKESNRLLLLIAAWLLGGALAGWAMLAANRAALETALHTQLEQELAQYESQLADPKVFGNVSLLQETSQKFEAVKKELDAKQEKWEELMLEAEELEARLSE